MSTDLENTRRNAKEKTLAYRDDERSDLALDDLVAWVTGPLASLEDSRAYAQGVNDALDEVGQR
jgi:hypothetical protein